MSSRLSNTLVLLESTKDVLSLEISEERKETRPIGNAQTHFCVKIRMKVNADLHHWVHSG